jgi:kynurenine formamidase
MISSQDLEPHLQKIGDAKAILMYTGFSKCRKSNPGVYTDNHPYLDPGIPDVLRERCKYLSLFGMDLISVSVPSHRETGRECHRSFLCRDNPILLLEDACIPHPDEIKTPITLLICPWFLDDLDASPVTAFIRERTEGINR